ncbi:MAG: tetratricopeptide repeat protein, partial [Planctomycetota bacterium]
PPTPAGRTFDVSYSFVPLREGTYDMPASTLRYNGEGDRVERVPVPGGHSLSITRNLKLPLAGREREWKRVTEHLSRERTACVLVTSEGGGGRSRFVDEAGEWLTAHGRAVFKGKALERGGEPLKVFLDIARQIFGVGTAALGSRGMMARVIDRLAPLMGEDPALAGFFSSFLRGTRVPESQARMRGYLWFRLLSALAAERPVVLLLTDLQWGDGESIDLMEGLVRRAHEDRVPLTVIASSLDTHREDRVRRRISSLSERVAALSAEPGLVCRVELRALDVDAVRNLVGHMFPGSTLDDDVPWLVPILARQSGGNVFHLMQILRLLRESRDETGEPLVSAEEGSWTIRPELTEERLTDLIPQATDGMVRAIIRTLPEEVRDVLARAAFIGAEFGLDLLRATRPDREIPDGALAALERADLVHVTDREGTRYRFTNSIVPAIVRRMEDPVTQRHLNRDVARAMESTLTERQLRRRALAYARRLQFAGEPETAFGWYVIAARRYVREQLFLRARRALRGAAGLLAEGVPPPADEFGIYHFLRGEVARVTGDLGLAQSAYGEAIDHLDREDLATAFSRMGRIHEIRGEPDRAVHCYEVAAEVRVEVGARAGLAHSENDLGSVELLRGNDEAARTRFERAREFAEETGNRSALAKALDQLAGLALRRGDWEEADRLYRESFDLGERAHDRVGMAHSLNGLGGMAFRRGDLTEAARRFQQAMDLRREVGDREGVANLLINLGVIHDRRGEFERALQFYRRATEAHRAIGSR